MITSFLSRAWRTTALVAAFVATSGSAQSQLVWNGMGPGSQDNDWDLLTNGPKNWLAGGASTQFALGNALLFGDIAVQRSQLPNYSIDVGGLSGGVLLVPSITIQSTNTYTFNQSAFFGTSIVADSLHVNSPLELNGSGVFANTFLTADDGITVAAGGSLTLGGGGDRISDTTPITLAGGQLGTTTPGLMETIGTLTLAADSVLDLAGSSTSFTFSSPTHSFVPGSYRLNVWNWDSGDSLTFDAPITPEELAMISFFSDNGLTPLGPATYLPQGGVAPIPEPSCMALLILGSVAIARLRKRRRD